MKTTRLALLRLWHEGNSFAAQATTETSFQAREWVKGAAAHAFYDGTATELGGVLAVLAREPQWQGVFLRCAAAPPGGPVAGALYDALLEEICQDLGRERWDAVYISLHGALVAEHQPEGDLTLLRAVRAAIGEAPLAVTFDLHANLSPEVGPLVDVLVGYKTYPHIDMAQTAEKALTLLAGRLSGATRPCCRIAKAGCLLTSHAMRTDAGPMAEIESLAAAMAESEGLLDVTPFGGFAYGDTPSAGASVAVTADGDVALAQACAERLAAEIRARRARFRVTLPDATAALAAVPALARPAAVLEPADNPLSGGGADTPGLFAALLAAAPDGPVAFAFFCDPALVERARLAGVGAMLEARLGGRLTDAYGSAVHVVARVLRLTDGRFVNDGPMERGLAVDMGPSVVLEVAGIEVVVASSAQAVNDPAWFRLHGIVPEHLALFCVKAKNHFRAAFGPSFPTIIECDTPGPAGLDLAALPFRHLPPALKEDWPGCAVASR